MPVLRLDSGNFRDVPTAAGDTRTDALLQAMQILGYQVANVGERDVRLGYDEFVQRTGKLSLEFLSANIIREDTRSTLFKPHLILDAVSTDGTTTHRVGIIGVVRANPLFRAPGPEDSLMVIDDPVARVRAEVQTLREEGVDAIIVLAALHKFDARKILEKVEGIDFVLGSHGDTMTPRLERYGDGGLMYGGNRGQRIVETRMFFDGRAENFARVHYLTGAYSFDPKMLEFVNSIYNDTETDASEAKETCEDGTAP